MFVMFQRHRWHIFQSRVTSLILQTDYLYEITCRYTSEVFLEECVGTSVFNPCLVQDTNGKFPYKERESNCL